MSQVICEEDELSAKRAASREQEHLIIRDTVYRKWQNPSSGMLGFVAKVVGIATLPIVGIWMVLLAGVSFAFGLIGVILKILGGSKSKL